MSRIAYVNGAYLPQRHASVNVEDRGYQFADGVYEVVLLVAGEAVDEGLHLDRLDRSLRALSIRAPMTREALRAVMREVARRNRLRDGLLYIQVTRGVASRDHAFPSDAVPPSIVVMARRIARLPRSLDGWTASAVTEPDQRWARCDIKSVALLPNVLARQQARARGAFEAILYDAQGHVTEGASTSVWIVDASGVLRTRPLGTAILPGCTREALVALLSAEAVAFEERAFTLAELRAAREVFLTSATNIVRPVVEIDGATVGDGRPGPVAQRLFAAFTSRLRRAA